MINVWFLPSLVEGSLANRVVVVIDVLRATTTIVAACAAGAREVIPCEEIAAARQLADRLGPEAVTGGERQGVRIEGFDLGNSPAEYTRASVGGKVVVFTTTNGTRAMYRCREARRILIAAFTNFSAVCQALAHEPEFDILCAGTNQQITREDVLLAGAIIADRQRSSTTQAALNDQAEIAADVWHRISREVFSHQPLWRILQDSRGGRHLLDIGHAGDIELAGQLDQFDILPQLDAASWRIRRTE